MYTAGICGGILVLLFLISWTNTPVVTPPVQDLIEINLGNNEDGFGEEQPLIKGERSMEETEAPKPTPTPPQPEEESAVKPEDNASEEAAPVNKPAKKPVVVKKTAAPTPVVPVTPVHAKPKITYKGPGNGNGNNATEDNGYKYQGNTPGGKGDAGDPNGNKDSYGNSPGGRIGGPRVIGNRKIVKYYSFGGDLPKAVINAIVKVSPAGQGTFVSFGKGSTTRDSRYASAIARYLQNVTFDKSGSESTVTVVFNFNEN